MCATMPMVPSHAPVASMATSSSLASIALLITTILTMSTSLKILDLFSVNIEISGVPIIKD